MKALTVQQPWAWAIMHGDDLDTMGMSEAAVARAGRRRIGEPTCPGVLAHPGHDDRAAARRAARLRRMTATRPSHGHAGFTVQTDDAGDGEVMARITWKGIAFLPAQEAFDLLLNPPKPDTEGDES